MATKTITLKLLVNNNTKKVLFAEAGKDFVDFLLSVMTMPISTVIELLDKRQMVGSLGKLYGSLEDLSNSYMQTGVDKDLLLHRHMPSPTKNHLLLENNPSASTAKSYFCCNSKDRNEYYGNYTNHLYVSDTEGAKCPKCKGDMRTSMEFVAMKEKQVSAGESGYVKGVVTYMVMDDLEVSPMSTISSITLLNKFQIKEVGALEEKTVTVDFDDGVKLLKASLHSSTVLTDVFM